MTGGLVFRGGRDYVLAADIIDYVRANLPDGVAKGGYDFNMIRKTAREIALAGVGEDIASGSIVASYKSGGTTFFVREGGRDVTGRMDCDEKAMESSFSLEGNTIGAPAPSVEASFSRMCVVAFKHVLNTVVRPEAKEHYVLARLMVDEEPEGDFAVRYSRMVGGRFHEGVILDGDRRIGRIYFGLEDRS